MLDQLDVQYSTNGVQWSGQADFTAPAVLRYIRIVNNTDSAVTCDLEKLGVTAENLKMNPSVLEHSFTNALKEGKWDNLFDGDKRDDRINIDKLDDILLLGDRIRATAIQYDSAKKAKEGE